MSNNEYKKTASMKKRQLHLDNLEEEYYLYMNMTDILYIIYLALGFEKAEAITLYSFLI